ncbi:hypothetical protein LIER_20056 [Lithospermum erythrorhizon]|uniref:Uncharacterized protein n=1 Tax=Lithospermum erythrorhizon TaxID=34254 RepID=A0AAV3QN39_LITER
MNSQIENRERKEQRPEVLVQRGRFKEGGGVNEEEGGSSDGGGVKEWCSKIIFQSFRMFSIPCVDKTFAHRNSSSGFFGGFRVREEKREGRRKKREGRRTGKGP